MKPDRFAAITDGYSRLRLMVVGDFFLDRYLIIDPSKAEVSIETGLPVHNVVAVRSQPGAAGTIVNNLVALGVGEIRAVGYCGDDGEGYELRRALTDHGVMLDDFLTVPTRRTPVYCKPLIVDGKTPPRELNRFDSKNWSVTPLELQRELASRIESLASRVDALILMDQVDLPETGVVTPTTAAAAYASLRPHLVTLADSRRGLHDYPALGFKMNAAELARMTGIPEAADLDMIRGCVSDLASRHRQPVFVTLAERGIVGAAPGYDAEHVPSLPVRGPIDVVGAGDSVTANLTAALASKASIREAMEIAMAAASIVVHRLGTTGTASVIEIAASFEFERHEAI